MIEKFKEFKDTLSERIRSPFIGSFIITWSIIHWKVYALFLFNQENITITERIELIENYLFEETIWRLFIGPIFITLILLVAYAFLNAIGLVIKLGYDNWASPVIQSILNNKNIIEKPKYDRIKREYAFLKKNYDDDKDKLFKTEQDYKNLITTHENFKKSAFEGTIINDISAVMNKNTEWENLHFYPNSQTGYEIFKCDIEGFHLKDGKTIKLENIKIAQNGKILTFDKVIDGKYISNYLIRDEDSNYHGIENDNIKITYRKKKNNSIIINSAKYKSEENFIDAKSTLQRLVDNNITKIEISNETMGGDPGYGKPKILNVVYTIGTIQSNQTIHEGSALEIK